MAVLTPDELRLYIKDFAVENHLLDGEEFTDMHINLAMELAVGDFNITTPITAVTLEGFPNKSLLMSGTLYKLFSGRAALLARNTMNYSDGGIQVPVEERAQLYQSLAGMYQADFKTATQAYKIQMNIESGWGGVSSDYQYFPLY